MTFDGYAIHFMKKLKSNYCSPVIGVKETNFINNEFQRLINIIGINDNY